MNILINNVPVNVNERGMYSLNDLHLAAGGADNKKAAYFFRNDSTKAFINALSNCDNSHSYNDIVEKKSGRYGGTWVCSLLVYKYAAWINPDFEVRVFKTFEAVKNGDAHKAVAIASNNDRLLKIIAKRDSILSSKIAAGKKADKLCLLENEWIDLMSSAGKTLAIGRGQPMLFKQAEEQVLNEIQDKFEF